MKNLIKIVFYFWFILVMFTVSTYAQDTTDDINHLISISDGVNAPLRLAADRNGITYVTDAFRKNISKYDASGNFLEIINTVDLPISVAVNDDGKLFIGDGATGHIFIYDESIGLTEFYTGTQYPTSMVLSQENILYVSDSKLQQVVALDLSGNVVQEIGSGILDFPTGIAFDNNNKRILVGEHGGKGTGFTPIVKVWMFDLQGNLVNSFGSYGSGDGEFYRVQGLTVGRCGNIYVVDPYQGRISIFDESGVFITRFGDYGVQAGQMNIPMDIVFDSQGRLQVTSMNNSALELFTITDLLPSSNIKSGSAMICDGESTDIEIAFTGTAPWTFTYTIDGITPTEVITSDNPHILTVTEAGHYELTALSDANNSGTCFTGSTDITVTSIIPTSELTGDTFICTGSTADISIAFTGIAPWTYTYTKDNVDQTTITTTNNPYILKVSEAGNYAVTSLIGGGCTGTSFTGSVEITEKPLPTATITNGNGQIVIDYGETTDLNVALTGLAPWDITYTVDDLNPTTINNIIESTYSLTASDAGVYDIKLVSDTWCSSTFSLGFPDIVIRSSVVLPSSLIKGGDLSICPGESVPISILFTGTAPWTFTYNVDTLLTTTVFNTYTNPYILNAPYEGAYEITALSDNYYIGNEFTGNTFVSVDPFPIPDFNFSTNSLDVSFTNISEDADSYFWDFGDGSTSDEMNPVHNFPSKGEYEVSLTAANTLCGESTLSKTINIQAVSVDAVELGRQLNIYPNPSNGMLTIEIGNAQHSDINIEIINMVGKKVFTKVFRDHKSIEQIDLSSLSKGIYFVKMNSENYTKTLKLILN
ncbi:MAG: T9SS type A sorting domain-containing protein [Bacteroidales bacterium]|nr:T9SS type A sorting domain-containing protein [Bacteroidales bacterium]